MSNLCDSVDTFILRIKLISEDIFLVSVLLDYTIVPCLLYSRLKNLSVKDLKYLSQ